MRTFRMVRVGLVGSILAGALASLATFGSGASADTLPLPLPLPTTTTSTSTTTPLFVNWADLLPTLTDAYDPTSTNDCVAGRPTSVDITIREMTRRFDPLGQSCND